MFYYWSNLQFGSFSSPPLLHWIWSNDNFLLRFSKSTKCIDILYLPQTMEIITVPVSVITKCHGPSSLLNIYSWSGLKMWNVRFSNVHQSPPCSTYSVRTNIFSLAGESCERFSQNFDISWFMQDLTNQKFHLLILIDSRSEVYELSWGFCHHSAQLSTLGCDWKIKFYIFTTPDLTGCNLSVGPRSGSS